MRRDAAAAAVTVYLAIGSVSFGLWQDWWLCVGALAMVLCILLGKTLDHTDAPRADGETERKGEV